MHANLTRKLFNISVVMFDELIPAIADLQTFLHEEGSPWREISIVPWQAGPNGHCFVAVKSGTSRSGLGRVFDALHRPTAALALATVKRDFYVVLLKIREINEELLFFVKKSSR